MLRPDSHQQWSGKRSAKAYMGTVGGGGRQASLAVDAPERRLSCAAAANIVVAFLPPSDRRSAGERLRRCTRIGPGAPADDRENTENWRRHYNEDRYTRPRGWLDAPSLRQPSCHRPKTRIGRGPQTRAFPFWSEGHTAGWTTPVGADQPINQGRDGQARLLRLPRTVHRPSTTIGDRYNHAQRLRTL